MFSTVKAFFGLGYKACNDQADAVLKECLERPAGVVVAAPWIGGGQGLEVNGRINAVAAIGSNCFGVARNDRGAYRFYYRRSMTGNWFAEVWTLWKSAIVAAPLLFLMTTELVGDPVGRLLYPSDPAVPALSFGCMLLGLVTALAFLPRGLLSVGCQYQVATTTGRGFSEPAGLLNLAVGMTGANLFVMALFQEWDVAGFVALTAGSVGWMAREWFALSIGLAVLAGGLALTAAAFWYISFQYLAARATSSLVFQQLPYRSPALPELYKQSFHCYADNFRASQIALASLIYVVMILGFANAPLFFMARNLFS